MESKDRDSGVSIVLCCHNSVARIGAALRHVADQIPTRGLEWEVILVDNASTDGTAKYAEEYWMGTGVQVPFTIIAEPKAGLLHARNAGLQASKYPFVLFCDDDNLLDRRYLSGVNRIMQERPQVAACGGTGIPLFQSPRPDWFDDYAEVFATGRQDINVVDGRLLCLYGAGICLRKSALDELHEEGFQPNFLGRKGKELSSSEDTELTNGLVLSGHELFWDENLTFQHLMPPERLTKEYLKKIFVANGKEGPVRNLYYSHLIDQGVHKHIRNWYLHMGLSLFRFAKYFISPPKPRGRSLYFHWNLAYLKNLIRIRKDHRAISDRIATLKHPMRPAFSASSSDRPLLAACTR